MNTIKSYINKHILVIGFPVDQKAVFLNALESKLSLPGNRPEIVYKNAINSLKRKARK